MVDGSTFSLSEIMQLSAQPYGRSAHTNAVHRYRNAVQTDFAKLIVRRPRLYFLDMGGTLAMSCIPKGP